MRDPTIQTIALRNFTQKINQDNLNTMAPITTKDEI